MNPIEKQLLFFDRLTVLAIAAPLIFFLIASVHALLMTWAIFHCLRFYPEHPNKWRWLVAIITAPIAGSVAYLIGGRQLSTNKNFF